MDRFLAQMFEEEMSKQAAADAQEFFRQQPKADLEAFLGIRKRAVAEPGGAEAQLPDSKPGKALDAKMRAVDTYSAKARLEEPPTREQAETASKVNFDGPSVAAKQVEKAKEAMLWADRMGRKLASIGRAPTRLERNMQKVARIFGLQQPDDVLMSPQVPYEHRRGAYEGYLKGKSEEAPTSLLKALGGGAAIGAGVGGLIGAPGGWPGAGVGAIGGGLAGLATGALMRHADKQEIARAQQALGGDIDQDLAGQIGMIGGQRAEQELSTKERRHAELIDAIKNMQQAGGRGAGTAGEFAGGSSMGGYGGGGASWDPATGYGKVAAALRMVKAAATHKELPLEAPGASQEEGDSTITTPFLGLAGGAGVGKLMMGREGAASPRSGLARGALGGILGQIGGGTLGEEIGAQFGRPSLGANIGQIAGTLGGGALGGYSARPSELELALYRQKQMEKGSQGVGDGAGMGLAGQGAGQGITSLGGLGDTGVGEDKTTIACARSKIAARAMTATRGAPEHIKRAAAELAGRQISKLAFGVLIPIPKPSLDPEVGEQVGGRAGAAIGGLAGAGLGGALGYYPGGSEVSVPIPELSGPRWDRHREVFGPESTMQKQWQPGPNAALKGVLGALALGTAGAVGGHYLGKVVGRRSSEGRRESELREMREKSKLMQQLQQEQGGAEQGGGV